MKNRKKNAEERIRQLKNQAVKDIKNASVKIAIKSVEKLIKNSKMQQLFPPIDSMGKLICYSKAYKQ